METDFQVGDKVRLTVEGTVTYRYPEGDKGISIRSDAPYIYGYDEDEDIITVGHGDVLKGHVELVERAWEVFPVGAVVRNKMFHDYVYTITEKGWYDHYLHVVEDRDDSDAAFTSESYERLA